MATPKEWNQLAARLCIDSIRATTEAGSGHPTSSMSAAHLAAVLFSDHLRYDVANPKSVGNDRFILSKGHAAPLLYSVLKALGAITDERLLSLRKFRSPIEGHPVPVDGLPWVDVATGSLGQGLAMGLGMALAMRLAHRLTRVWVLLGDSESAEGSNWEAMQQAAYYKVGNLVAILDMNRLGQRGPTMLGWDAEAYARRAEAFGWQALVVDGHDVVAIDRAYREATHASDGGDRPHFIVARTVKGHGVSFLANAEGWHGKVLSPNQAAKAIAELERGADLKGTHAAPVRPPLGLIQRAAPAHGAARATYRRPVYSEEVATRKAFGDTLAALATTQPRLVVLDGEVGNSTYTEEFHKVAPERFFELFIAEQAMIGAAVGMQALGLQPACATFGAFITRAYDFIRMAAISRATLRLCGSHAGVSIGEDGPSQMALEDFAMMRAVSGSTVLCPADGNATVRLVEAMMERSGISYLRTAREKTPCLYEPGDEFPIGGSKVLRTSANDRATLVATGVTVFEALKAADALLRDDRIAVRVIDAYSIKPVDARTFQRALGETGTLVVVEDHWFEGGLGDAVLAGVARLGEIRGRVVKLAVGALPGSGTGEEQREAAGISARSIAATLRALLREAPPA